MLNLIDTPRTAPTDTAALAPRLALRPRGYAGPERRSVASLHHRRLAQMLDAIDYGMLLMADDHRVAHANKAARRDLDASHPLMLAGDELHTRSVLDAQPLREAMVSAAQRGLRRLLHLGGALEGQARVSVAVVPLAALGAEQTQGVALLLGKRQVCEELTVDWFARTHSLTMAETAVIKGLCADLTPQEIAVRQGVGLATIRTQIGSIRHKTGAGSIRALVRQVALLPPLVSALQSAASSTAAVAGTLLHPLTPAGTERRLHA
jgi:DNA-binding CsgD family transcriptional regulator